jgi:hypothetical protein
MYHLPLEKLLGGFCYGQRSRRASRGTAEEALAVDGEPQGEWWPAVGMDRRESGAWVGLGKITMSFSSPRARAGFYTIQLCRMVRPPRGRITPVKDGYIYRV